MARVNHKIVMQRLNEKRSKITDKQFFSSRILAGHFEDIASAQTRRYKYNRRVRVNLYWKPKTNFVAATDNRNITINCGNPLVTKVRGRENRYNVVCGLFAHELGHILYTDFLTGQTHINNIAHYRWYPEPPDLKTASDMKNEKALWEYVKSSPDNLELVQNVAHRICNVLEDGYIENRMLLNFPGTLGYGLETVRDVQFKQMPTVTQMIEQEDDGQAHIFQNILELILSYAKFGKLKYGDEPLSDERIQTVFNLIPEIDQSLTNHSYKERLKTTNTIMVRCWEYIEEFLELCKTQHNDAMASGESSDLISVLSGALGSMKGGSEIATGSDSPVGESEEEDASATAENRAETRSDVKSESDDENSSASHAGSDSENSSSESEGDDEGNIATGEAGFESEGKQETTENEGKRIPYHQTDSVSEPLGGKVERNDSYEREKYSNAATDIERILDKMAEKAACKELENERLAELNDVAQNISYGNIHSGVDIRVNRITDVDEDLVNQYNMIAGPLLNISRQLQKSLVQKLKEERRGGKQTNLLMGRRLNARALCRNDGKVFYKNALPNEIPELAVGLLLDESGSMGCSDRCTYARASAIILYDFCKNLNIPVMVYGHSTHGYSGDVDLYSYAEFDSIDNDNKYRMMDIAARSSNRDGAALRFVAEQLSKRPESVKILILVSDGQPAAAGYGGTAAEEDLRGIKREYQKKNILFVAAAIGDDKESIERIYGDSFMDITDLNQLPIKLTAVVKRHIKAY